MTPTETPNKRIHEGRNVKRFREMLGIKQEALAFELGEEWNQKKISILETKKSIETSILEQVAAVLKLPVEAFKILTKNRRSISFRIHLTMVLY